jgi:hypothetical protein
MLLVYHSLTSMQMAVRPRSRKERDAIADKVNEAALAIAGCG